MRQLIIIILLLSLQIVFTAEPNDRGFYIMNGSKDNIEKDESTDLPVMADLKINTLDTFENLFMNNKVALLIGNDDYVPDSGFQPLTQCKNDVRLIASILTTCCNVPDKNVFKHTNLTAHEFRKVFKEVTTGLKPGQGFIFAYSGHGDKDGALVFTDGERILPEELKSLVNSFGNDTVMLLDACYSGNNEGPINYNPDFRFKDNCLRIYASLAHLSAKEIQYVDEYYGDVLLFYENVLGLTGDEALDGNGYFTSFIGYFFAEYQMSDYSKITFYDMYRYISNKSNEYVEYLALRSEDMVENEKTSYSTELSVRMDQRPKMLPYNRDVNFKIPMHKNLVMIKPDAMIIELYTAPVLLLGTIDSTGYYTNPIHPVTVANAFRMSYCPGELKGLFFGVELGHMFLQRTSVENLQHMVPIMGIFGYRHQFMKTKNIVGMRADIGAGIGIISFPDRTISDDLVITFKFQCTTGISFQPAKNFYISFDTRFFGSAGVGDKRGDLPAIFEALTYGLSFPVAVSYKF